MGTEVERQIAGRIVDDALAAGYEIEVNDGENSVVTRCKDREQVLDAMFSTDADTLYMDAYSRDGVIDNIGFVYLVYGNGVDVIADSAGSAEFRQTLLPAKKLAEDLTALEFSAMHAGEAIAALANAGGA